MIAAFEEAILQCPNETARAHIREAVRCYDAGAYRAAIVSAYVAVTFDLIDKLQVLAAAGDGDAQNAIAELGSLREQQNQGNPQAIGGLLKFERTLIELFRDKFDFFGAHEFEDLDRLRADRNRCAHPTFTLSALPYSPAAELARLHIRNALALVLTQAPRQGKAALAGLRTVVLSPYFPIETAEAVERLRNSELANARPALLRAFVDDLAFGWPDPAHPYHQKRAASVAIAAVVELNRAGTLDRVRLDTDKLLLSSDKDAIRFGVAIALRIVDVGEALSEPAKTVARSWLKDESSPFRAAAIARACSVSWLADAAREAAAGMTLDELAGIVGTDIPDEIVQRAVELFSSAGSWSVANSIADRAAVPFAPRMTQAQIDQIILSSVNGQADLQGSNGFKRFLNAVANENPLGTEGVNQLLEQHELEHLMIASELSAEDKST